MKSIYASILSGLLCILTIHSYGQISVSSPTTGTSVNSCSTYIIRFSPGSGFSGNAIAEVHQNNTSGPIVQTIGPPSQYLSVNYDNVINASGLSPGNYQIKVRDAYNSSNYAWSGVFTVTSLTPPSSISQTANYYNWIEINWPVVSGATSYGVDVATSSDFSTGIVWTNHSASGADPYGLYITGLTAGTTYYVRIKSSGPCGTTGYSTTYSFSTLTCTPPGTPTANAATSVKSTSFIANWTSVPQATEGYDIVVTRLGSSVTYSAAAGATSKLIDLQHPSSSYSYVVRSKSACAQSGNSNSVNLNTASLGVPVFGQANGGGGTGQPFTWTVNWSSIEGATQYQFQVSTSNTFSSLFVDVTSDDGTESFEGSFCTTYYVRVRSRCYTGEYSAWSLTKDLPGGACRQITSENVATTVAEYQDIDMNEDWSFFPNPADEALQIVVPRSMDIQQLQFHIVDLSGRNLIVPLKISPQKAELDVRSIPSGIYIILMSDGKVKRKTKFIRK